MTAESLLTFFGLIVAVIALIPQERWIDLRIRLHAVDYFVIFIALLIVHYILFFPILRETGLAFDLGQWRWGFTEETASYLTLLVAAVFVGLRTVRSGLTRSKLPLLQRQCEQLLYQKRFAELTFLLESHLRVLTKNYHRQYWLFALRERLLPAPRYSFLRERPDEPGWLQRAGSAIRQWIGRHLPAYQWSQDLASGILRRLLVNRGYVTELASANPYLGLKILESDLPDAEVFQELWLTALLADPGSVLLYEISLNQNQSQSLHRYDYPESNRILRFYFANAKRAHELAVYKPIGDFVLRLLAERRVHPDDDKYNLPLPDDWDHVRLKDPIYSVLGLFDFMVTEALFQGIEWHMWLFYLRDIAKYILENLDPTAEVDESREWPTPYHSFLYEIVCRLERWIEATEACPERQANVVLKSNSLDHENGNIPKSAIIALGSMMKEVLQSTKLTNKFKAYLLEICLRAVGDLELHKLTAYADLVLRSLARGGSLYGARVPATHSTALINALGPVDWVVANPVRAKLMQYLDEGP